MAIAALEALDELYLFGVRGSSSSVIHVMSDEIQKCRAVLQNMLPRESLSKETDAALLTVIGYPAFAVDDRKLIEQTQFEVRIYILSTLLISHQKLKLGKRLLSVPTPQIYFWKRPFIFILRIARNNKRRIL